MSRLPAQVERAAALDAAGARIARAAAVGEGVHAGGLYFASCLRPVPHLAAEYVATRDAIAGLLADEARGILVPADRLAALRRDLDAIPLELVWTDGFANTVVTEGKNALLTHFLKGSSYTASQVLGLIEDTGYSAIGASNTAAALTAAGGGSPANGWNEAPSSTCASRGTPSFGSAAAGALATSSAVGFSIIASDTIKGAFLLCRSTAGTAPTSTVGNTNGALYSAGLFTGGDKSVANGDTLSVSYTASA